MDIKKVLKSCNNRVTPERVAIFDFIQTKHLFTYNDIIDHFDTIGRASVFRTLNLFLDIGVIRKVDVGNKTMTYEINDEDHHHEYMTCQSCENIISFESDDICSKIFREAEKKGFQIKSHNIGVLGTCKDCV